MYNVSDDSYERCDERHAAMIALSVSLLAVLLILAFGLIGYLGGVRRGVMALAGTLLGSTLVNFWAGTWGTDLAHRVGSQSPVTLTTVTSITVFVLTVLIVGYGSGILFDRTKERSSFSQGFASMLLGMLNGALIIGYVILFATVSNPALRSTIRSSLTGRIFSDGLPWLFLVITLATAAIVIVRFIAFVISARRSQNLRQGLPNTPRPIQKQDQQTSKQPIGTTSIGKPQTAHQAQREHELSEKIGQRLS